MLEAVLLAAALVAGVTGAWSPCGFSMVETLAPHGYAGRLRTTLVACATFAPGALAGGVATFGGLALLGRALGAGGAAAIAVAAAVALAAAAGEARGARIVPQVRRQVPGVVAPRAAAAARRRALRHPARARLHDLHPHLRRVGAGGRQRRARRPGARAARRARLRRRPRAAGRRARAARRHGARGRGARRDGRAPRDPARAARRRRGSRWPPAPPRCAAAPAQARRACSPSPATRPERRRRARRLPGAGRRRRARAAGRADAGRCPGRIPRSAAASSPGSARARVEVRSQSDPAYVFTLPAAADAVAVSGDWVAWRTTENGRDALVASALPPAAPARAGRRARRREHDARPPRAGGRPAAVPRRGRVARRIDEVRLATGSRSDAALARRARCCSTRPATAGGCSTCARPSSASSCGSAR